MADNNYKDTNKESDWFKTTRPLASPDSVMKLKIVRTPNPILPMIGSFVVTGAGAQVAFTDASTADYRFVNVFVKDQDGNQVSNTGSGTTPTINVDTSGLNAGQDWTVQLRMNDEDNFSLSQELDSPFEFILENPSSNPTETYDTSTLEDQVIEVRQADNSTVVADGGTYDLGTVGASGGGPYDFDIYIVNTGDTVLTITSITPGADVLTSAFDNAFDVVIYPGESHIVSGTVDGAGGPGVESGDIVIASDDPSNASYTVNVDWTLT